MRLGVVLIALFFAPILALSAQGSAFSDAKNAAQALYRNKDYAAAAAMCQVNAAKYGDKDVSSAIDNYFIWSQSLSAMGKYRDSLGVAVRLRALSPYDYRTVQILGEIYYLLGDDAEAMPYLRQYVTISPTGSYVARVYYYMGEIYLRKAMYNHADIAFSAAVYHSPGSAKWWYRLGYAREMAAGAEPGRAGRNSANVLARAAYERVLTLNPSDVEAKQRLAGLRQGK